MSHVRILATLTVAAVVLGTVCAGTARAEFFGCNDRPGKVLYDSGWHSSRYIRSSQAYSTQPRRVSRARVTYSSQSRYYVSRYR
jgi:hypothetical protein